MIYYCPGGNNKTFDSSKLQNKHGPIQSVFYFHRFRLQVKFIGKYLLKSSYPLDYTPLQHPDARTTPVRGIHDAIDRPIIVLFVIMGREIVRRRKCELSSEF